MVIFPMVYKIFVLEFSSKFKLANLGEAQNETDEFKITKQEHPDCAIKIQVNTQPIVTLPGEDDPNSNLVSSVPMGGEAAPLLGAPQTHVQTEHTIAQSGGTTVESYTATWQEPSSNATYQYNTEYQVTQVVSDNIPVNFLEM
jgi:hypothetical protein